MIVSRRKCYSKPVGCEMPICGQEFWKTKDECLKFYTFLIQNADFYPTVTMLVCYCSWFDTVKCSRVMLY